MVRAEDHSRDTDHKLYQFRDEIHINQHITAHEKETLCGKRSRIATKLCSQKVHKKISTHHLTVLTIGVILHLEHR